MLTGISVPFGIFTGSASGGAAVLLEAFSSADAFLDFCAKNFDAAELRTVKADTTPRVVLNAVKRLKSRGLYVTIHGALDENFFAPYEELLAENLQESYTVTVHPLATHEKTVEALSEICKKIEENAYQVTIALENQRLKETKHYGTCADVARVAQEINSKALRLCFDFGHQLNNEKTGAEPAPSDDFFAQVVHTHIHSLGARTHFPLCLGECLLDRNLTELLSRGYSGVLNLELSPERYCDSYDVRSSLVKSKQILKAAEHQVFARIAEKAFYQRDYENRIRRAMAEFDSADNIAMLLGPSAYVIKLRGVRIAIDVAPRILPISESAKSLLEDWISKFDAHIVTHGHSDHCDYAFIAALSPSVKKIIPDFLALDINGRVTVTGGSTVKIGDLTLKFFDGAHFFEGKGVLEYAFAIEVDGEHYVFPVDARDYSFKYPEFDNVRAVFTHLWLGRDAALKLDELYVDDFCRFARSFGTERIYTAHLLETRRDITNMWSDIHLAIIRERIPCIEAPRIGELIRLGE